MSERKLRAYYYGFEPTGCDQVDAILEAVAAAGKAFHHTDDWHEPYGSEGLSPVQRIQRAANDAARAYGQCADKT